MPCVVADTSPLFYLAKLGRLTLLRDLYDQVYVPPEVWRETLAGSQVAPNLAPQFSAAATAGWLIVSEDVPAATEPEICALDPGERDAIALARYLQSELLIIDEKQGRRVAMRFGLAVTGTLGVLLNAKQRGWISELKPELLKLREQTEFRFSAELEQHALRLANESPPPPVA